MIPPYVATRNLTLTDAGDVVVKDRSPFASLRQLALVSGRLYQKREPTYVRSNARGNKFSKIKKHDLYLFIASADFLAAALSQRNVYAGKKKQ
jgi:hypothetical protein